MIVVGNAKELGMGGSFTAMAWVRADPIFAKPWCEEVATGHIFVGDIDPARFAEIDWEACQNLTLALTLLTRKSRPCPQSSPSAHPSNPYLLPAPS